MRIAQHVASLAAVSLLGLTPIALASPAGADEPVVTAAELTGNQYTDVVQYGQTAYLRADVKDVTSGYTIREAGSTRVQQSVAGGAWKDTSLTAPGGWKSFQVTPKANTKYRLQFSGGTAQNGTVYAPSTSAVVSVKVAHRLKYAYQGSKLTVTLKPKAKNKKITFKVSKKRDGKYKTYKRVRTNSKGKATVTLPRGTRYWTVVASADSKFTRGAYQFSTYRSTFR